MDTSKRKRKFSTPCVDNKKQRRTSMILTGFKMNMNNKLKATKNGRGRDSPTLVQNNRELATALNKARSRIRELENERFQLQGDHQQLMEKYSAMNVQLQKLKDEHRTMQDIDSKLFTELCQSLRSKLQKATEKLLESTTFLAGVDTSVATLEKMSNSRDRENQNCSFGLSMPLEVTCDSIHRSEEAALSITKLTPSPSSASSSDSFEMASPELSGHSASSVNQSGLLTTRVDDHHSIEEMSVLHDVLDSTQNSPMQNKVLNTLQESMDSHDLDVGEIHPGLMDIDLPRKSDRPVLNSTPDCSPIQYIRTAFHLLASTPEDCEVSRFAANLSAGSPQISPALALCPGRRMLRRRNAAATFGAYKEPSLISKLRQGDPFTDCSLFKPSSNNKRKTKQSGDNLRKKNRK